MNKQKEKILKAFEEKFGTRSDWNSPLLKPVERQRVLDNYDNIKQFLSKALDSILEETLVEVEEKCRKIAHRSELKVGGEGFGYHYEICSYLAGLKTKGGE